MNVDNSGGKPRVWLWLSLLAVAGTAIAQTQTRTQSQSQSQLQLQSQSQSQSQSSSPGQPVVAAHAPDSVTPEAWFQSMDSDRNKQLSLDEFKAGLVARNQAIVFQRLQTQFRAVDRNSSGFLEADEFYQLPIIKKAAAAAPTLAAVDTSKDGKLDFREYVGLIAKLVGMTP